MRSAFLGLCVMLLVGEAPAQPPIDIQAPFTRVFIGIDAEGRNVVRVRAPFVNLVIPRGPRLAPVVVPPSDPTSSFNHSAPNHSAPNHSATLPSISGVPVVPGASIPDTVVTPEAAQDGTPEPPFDEQTSDPPFDPDVEELPPPADDDVRERTPPLSSVSAPATSTPDHSTETIQPVAFRPSTLREFARNFRPLPGSYEVELQHPHTGHPVVVQFRLPNLPLEDIEVESDEIRFEYDDFEVELDFKRSGRVRVEYDVRWPMIEGFGAGAK